MVRNHLVKANKAPLMDIRPMINSWLYFWCFPVGFAFFLVTTVFMIITRETAWQTLSALAFTLVYGWKMQAGIIRGDWRITG